MSVQPETPRKQFKDECSDVIDIRQPSDFFLKYTQAIKLSILVIQTIGIAAAFFGVSVKDVLPSDISSICDLDNLSDIMDNGLGAAEEAFSAVEESSLNLEEREPSTRAGAWQRLKPRLLTRRKSASSSQPRAPAIAGPRTRDDPAHLVLQHFLASNSVEWKTSVQCKLKLAHNAHHGYTYVCMSDPQHEKKWELREGDGARGPKY
eukprot:g11550.t1